MNLTTLRWLLIGVLLGVAAAWLVQRSTKQAIEIAEHGRSPRPATAMYEPLAKAHVVAQALRNGGHLIYFRHAQRQKWDSVIAFDVYELATGADSTAASYADAVCLTPQGVEEGRMIGEIFRLARIPVGTVVASPSCRARQTATLAFDRIDATSAGLAHSPVTSVATAGRFRDELERVLRETPIPAGSNVAIVAHGNTLENHPDLFESGAEILGEPRLMETGFYVIRRDGERLTLEHEFLNLGEFAANGVALDVTPGGAVRVKEF